MQINISDTITCTLTTSGYDKYISDYVIPLLQDGETLEKFKHNNLTITMPIVDFFHVFIDCLEPDSYSQVISSGLDVNPS